ncbi:Alpha-amylase 3, chloroplastic [Vitis vinifera]|uniref:alpha-amylase n=1 Tax=Vitis vinifera TaxID=29760 RepID=A0A438CS29_VITVI|nr:Alpha-amylase 3, chloroplastic [Vitis vinifera]
MDHNQDAHRQRIIDWINATNGAAGAFDVTTKGILHSALGRCEYWRLSDQKRKPPGVVGWWPSRAVTFIENHDTGSTQIVPQCSPKKSPLLLQYSFMVTGEISWWKGNARICIHPDSSWDGQQFSLIISSLTTDLKLHHSSLSEIGMRSIVGVQRRQIAMSALALSMPYINLGCHVGALFLGVHHDIASLSYVPTKWIQITMAERDVYAAIIDEKVAMKIGPGYYEPPKGQQRWTLALEGDTDRPGQGRAMQLMEMVMLLRTSSRSFLSETSFSISTWGLDVSPHQFPKTFLEDGNVALGLGR